MAINAATVWEIRTTGAQTYGGGWANVSPGVSVDYSQRDTPILSLSDISTNVAGTQLTSVTGGFTHAMEGSCVFLTGGGATPEWYQILAGGYIDTNNVTIDRSAGSSKSGVTGNVGGAFKHGGTLDSDFWALANKAAGNTIYVKSGTYTLGETITASISATAVAPITVIGYNATRGDAPTGSNRPLINCTSWIANFSDVTQLSMYNMIFTGAASSTFNATISVHYNCKFINTKATTNTAFYGSYNFQALIHCECVSTNGYAVQFSNSGSFCLSCYIHDSVRGVMYGSVIESVISNCTDAGVFLSSGLTEFIKIHGNTIYKCGTGVNGGVCNYAATITNNIISGCTVKGVSWTSNSPFIFLDYNCWYNGVNDVSNVTKGAHDITADPKLKDPDNDDYTLLANSPCFDAGVQLGSIVGL